MYHAEAALIHEWAKLNLVPLEVGSRANSTLLQISLSVAILESLHILLETLGLPLFLTELVPKFTSLIRGGRAARARGGPRRLRR